MCGYLIGNPAVGVYVCNLEEGIGRAFEESCLFSSKLFSFLQKFFLCTFYQKDLKRIPKSPISMTLHLLEFLLSVSPGLITYFCIFIVYVLIGVLLKDMVESCLLSKDELLTPNIGKVMAV